MKKNPFFIGIAVIAVVLLASGTSSGSACADDHHGLRGKCRTTIVNGVYYHDCVTAIDPTVTDCTYYVE